MRKKRLVGGAIQVPARGGEPHVHAAPVFRVVHPLHETLSLQLIDDPGDRAQPNLQLCGQLAHGTSSLEIENPQAIGLGNRQGPVEPFVQAAELVKCRDFVQQIVQPPQIFLVRHTGIYYDSRIIRFKK
jgi:hypothetical protein